MMREFLPISRDDMKKRGWDELDFVYVIGDAYVDHPSFGPAIISRVLEAHGYKVGIISHGFHGESLYGFKEKASSGRLYAGWRLRQKTGLCGGCLW